MQGGVQAPAPVLCRGGCSPIFWGVSSLKNCHSFCSTDSSCLFATAMVTCIDDSSQLQLYTSIAMVHAASRNWPQYDYHRLTSGPCELQWHASPRCKQQEFSTLPCISSKQFLLGFASPAWHLMRNAPTSLFYVRWMPNERLKTLKVWQHSKSTKATPSIMKSRQESKSSIYSANLRTQELQKLSICYYLLVLELCVLQPLPWVCLGKEDEGVAGQSQVWIETLLRHSSIKTTTSAKQGPLSPIRIRVWPASDTTLVSSDRSVSSSETCVVGHSIRILLGHAFHHPVLFDTFLGSPQAASLTSVTVSAWKASKSSWPGQSQPQQQYGRFGEAWVLKVLKWLVAPGSFFSSNPVASENATADFVRERVQAKKIWVYHNRGAQALLK